MSKILSFIVMLPRSVLWVLACLQGGKWRNTHSKRNLQKEEAIALDRRAEAQLVGWYDEYNENGRWDGRTGVYEYEVDGKKHRTEVYRSSGKLEETHIVYYRKDGIDCDAINTSALKYKALWGVLLIGDFFGMTGISLLPFIYFLDLERRFKTRLSTVNAQRTTLHDVGSKHYATYSYTVGEKVFTYYFLQQGKYTSSGAHSLLQEMVSARCLVRPI